MCSIAGELLQVRGERIALRREALRSPPPQNILPAPVRITARTDGSSLARIDGVHELASHLHVERVRGVGPVERDARDVVLHLVEQRFHPASQFRARYVILLSARQAVRVLDRIDGLADEIALGPRSGMVGFFCSKPRHERSGSVITLTRPFATALAPPWVRQMSVPLSNVATMYGVSAL